MASAAKRRPPPADDPIPQPPAEGEAAAPADPSVCPRCEGKLTNPTGLGWCPRCGYCRSLEEEGKEIAPPAEEAAPKKPSVLGASEFGEAMKRMPGWAWPLLGGVAIVAGVSVAADYLLPEECLARALWSALQMVLGVIGLIAAQLWAVLIVGAHEEGLGAKDVILPGRLWRATLRRLPETRKPVWLGAWCLIALVCGGAVVGGFNYWLEALKAKRLREVAEVLAGDGSPDAAAREAKATAVPAGSSSPAPAAGDKRPVTQCVVIGYQTDGTTVTGLVLAAMDGDRLQFVGVVREGLGPEVRQDLMSRLSRLVREEPLISGLKVKGVTWVKPGVFCDVNRGAGKPGEGEEPTFRGLRD